MTEKGKTKLDFFASEAGRKYDMALSALPSQGRRTLNVDFSDIVTFDEEFATRVLNDPEATLKTLEELAFSRLQGKDYEYSQAVGEVKLAVRHLPTEVSLRMVGAEGLWKLIQLRGMVTRMTAIMPYTPRMAFRCEKCGEVTLRDFKLQDTPKPPILCATRCRNKSFVTVAEQCVTVSSQRITMQENPEELPAGQIQRTLQCFLSGELVDQVRPGDHVTVTGVLKAVRPRGAPSYTSTMEFLLDVVSIESDGEADDLDLLSPEDEEAIQHLSEDPDLEKHLVESFDTWIYGWEGVKRGMIYQLVGGVEKHNEKSKTRGEINLLLLGDPGTGKSQLLIYQTKMARRGIYTMGVTSSGVGLTASVSKDSITGVYVVDAGAMVLADRGICAIDEIEKMSDEDRRAIHPAMEQGIVSVAKGGLTAFMNARASVIAAANPKNGRYNAYKNIGENIDLPTTILSRFDLIFLMKDEVNAERDGAIAKHVFAVHAGTLPSAPIGEGLLSKYLNRAKKLRPQLSKDVEEKLHEFYIAMRSINTQNGEGAAVSITTRQMESVVRLAEARAKIFMREKVTIDDMLEAMQLMRDCLSQVGLDVLTGTMDIDVLETGRPHSIATRLADLESTINALEVKNEEPPTREKIWDSTTGMFNHDEVDKLLAILIKDGTVFSPRPNIYKVIRKR